MSDMQDWLARYGLLQHLELFAREDIDLELLPHLTEPDLEKLGLSLGQRKRVMLAISELKNTRLTPVPELTVDAPEGSARARAVERRRITVMFCDIVGSVSISERLDPEDWLDLLQAYQQACGSVIAEYEGHVAQYLGDGLMVYFGWPQAYENSAERAAHAGLDILARVKAIPSPIPLKVRIGIATGPVVVGETGEGDASVPKAAVGPTPNLAARLQGLAEPDQIIIAPGTRLLLGQLYDFEDLGERMLKGLATAVRPWRIVGARRAVSRYDAMRGDERNTSLVGREGEMNVLRKCWQRACAGFGQGVLITGEAGIGKSRLISAFCELIQNESLTVVRYQCSPHYQNSPFYPVTEQLIRGAGFQAHDSVADRRAKLGALLEKTLGKNALSVALLSRLLALPPDTPDLLLGMTPQHQSNRTYELLEEQLAASARDQPLLLLVEDAHWCDRSTLEFVNRLLVQIGEWPALLVLTARPDFVPTWPTPADVARITLERLDSEHLRRLIFEVAGRKTLPPILVERILSKTDGVPLFVEELTKSLLEDPLLREDGGRYVLTGSLPHGVVPDTLHDALMERLDRFPQVKEVAQIGATIGREFEREILLVVSGLSDTYLAEALRQLIHAGLIVEVPEATTETYAFKHALLQDAAYSTVLRQQKTELHARVAQMLERLLPERIEAHPEVMAHHLAEGGDPARAIGFARRAGTSALYQSACAEAIAHARQALGWLEAIPAGDERVKAEIALNDILAPALMTSVGYASAELETIARRSLTLLEEAGDDLASFPTLWALKVFHHVRSNRAQARELAERLVRIAERNGDESQLVAALPLLAQCLWIEGDYSGARKALEPVMARYDATTHRMHALQFGLDSLAYCLMTLSQVRLAEGDLDGALDAAGEAVRIGHELQHANTIGLAQLFLLITHQQRGERDKVRVLGAETLEFCEQYTVVTPSSYARIIYNWAVGEVAESVAILEAHKSMKAMLGLSYYGGLVAETAAAAGLHEQARALFDDWIRFGEESHERYYLPQLYARRAALPAIAV